MREKTKWLEKYAPLGIDVTTELAGYIAGVIIATLQSLLFLYHYLYALGELYTTRAGKRVLIEGVMIQDFGTLMEGVFLLAFMMCGITLSRVAYYYIYHYQGSKMMYLMKRLPEKWELHKRCWTLPIAGVVLLVIWMSVLRMLYFAIYILCTPSQCLPL